jgi:hypothetical protein
MTIEEKQQYLEKIAADLGEHFDCIQILAHDSDTDTYSTYEAGSGSLFARLYQAMRWAEEPGDVVFEDDDDEPID